MINSSVLYLLSLGLLATPVAASAAPLLPAPLPAVTAPNCTADADPEEVVVCGRREEGQDQRLPQPEGFDPAGTVMSVPLERYKLLDHGATGIGSCSTVGPGGWTGCDTRRWVEERLQYAARRPGGGRRGVSVSFGVRPR